MRREGKEEKRRGGEKRGEKRIFKKERETKGERNEGRKGLMIYACNPSPQETETGGLPQVQGQSGIP